MSKKTAYLMAALAFALGFMSGNYAAKKGCPPIPAPAAQPHGDGHAPGDVDGKAAK